MSGPLPAEALQGAACTSLPMEVADAVFFTRYHTQQQKTIRTLCRGCTVRTRCLVQALALRQDEGVAGGTSAPQRAHLSDHLPDPVPWAQITDRIGDDWTRARASDAETEQILGPLRRHLHTGHQDDLRTHLEGVREGGAGPWPELSFQARLWVVAHLVHLDHTQDETARHRRWEQHLHRAGQVYRTAGLAGVRADPDLAPWLRRTTGQRDLPVRMRVALFGVGPDLFTPRPHLLDARELHLLHRIVEALHAGATDQAVRDRIHAPVDALVARAGLGSLAEVRVLVVLADAGGDPTVDVLHTRYPLAREAIMGLLTQAGLPVVHAPPGSAAALACPGRARVDRLAQALVDGHLPAWTQTRAGRRRADRLLALHGHPTVSVLTARGPHPPAAPGQAGPYPSPAGAGAGG